jgi:hypothetical protein
LFLGLRALAQPTNMLGPIAGSVKRWARVAGAHFA